MKIYLSALIFVFLFLACVKNTVPPESTLFMEWITIDSNLTFNMGDETGTGNENELPVLKVTLSAYQIGKYEVTNRQYCQFLNEAMAAGKAAYRWH